MTTDQSQHPIAICFGEILWDVLPDGPQPGGAPLNVAYHLTKLGIATSLISRIGNDENGRKLASLMHDWNIGQSLLQVDESYETSRVMARMNNGNEVTYEILFPVAWDFITKPAIRDPKYFIYGSLGSRNDVSRETLFELLDTTTAVKVFDINLRPPFFNRSLLETLMHKADIIKFNEAELDIVQVMFKGSYGNEQEKISFIQEKFEVPEIIVTKGEFGASYYKQDKAYHTWGNEVIVSDTIGSGDSFLAAFIANHYRGDEPAAILKKAIAMGGFIATQKGGCPTYQLAEYENFKDQIFKL
ncbi:MAG: carbohydrate kinase [Pedobacter sp.]|nr:MAG: carbohydrate kinase [Pedobacter sp.]